MKRLSLLLLIIFAFTFKLSAQTDAQQQAKIKEVVQLTGEAQLNGDYKAVAGYYYPPAVAQSGGVNGLVTVLEKRFEKLSKSGLDIKSITAGMPSAVVTVGQHKFAYVPQTMIAHVGNGTLTVKSNVPVVSDDNGTNWYVVTPDTVKGPVVNALFAEMDTKLTMPKPTEPVYTPDGN